MIKSLARTGIRDAKPEDAEIIAWIIFAAIDNDSISERMRQSCSMADTLYSWDKTRLLTVEGKVVGGLVAYQGDDYPRLREKTWPLCWDKEILTTLNSTTRECAPGEYYLDSMALLPEYRGRGLGKALIFDAIKQGREKGCASVTLLADKDKIGLITYYKSIGFEIYDSMMFLGHDYWKMKLPIYP